MALPDEAEESEHYCDGEGLTAWFILAAPLVLVLALIESPLITTPSIKVTMTELSNAYRMDDVAAQDEYGNRSLLISGRVAGIGLDIEDHAMIYLQARDRLESVRAHLTLLSVQSISKLALNDPVKLLCQNVDDVMGAPELRNCVLQ